MYILLQKPYFAFYTSESLDFGETFMTAFDLIVDRQDAELQIDGWYQLTNPISAPAFRLLDVKRCKLKNLGNIKADKLLMTFIPGVWAPWARKFLHELDSHYEDIRSLGAKAIAIVSQDEQQLIDYVEENPLDFTVLADPHGAISTRYGIFDEIITEPMQLSRPTLLVVDREKNIHFKYLGRHLTDRPGWDAIEWVLHQDINPKPSMWSSIPLIKQLFYAGN